MVSSAKEEPAQAGWTDGCTRGWVDGQADRWMNADATAHCKRILGRGTNYSGISQFLLVDGFGFLQIK